MSLSADYLERLLAEKHSKDVFIAQCKDGPTWNSNVLIMDGWAMNRSWANPITYGYEIKVARQDFMQDTKWRAYLPYCNMFYFVAPKGLIDPGELPAEAGLIVLAGKCKLITKKKAPHREAILPEKFYRYVLMCRTSICREQVNGSKLDYWRQWLEDCKEAKDLGYRVSRTMRDVVDRTKEENRQLRVKMETYDSHKRILESLGFGSECPESWSLKSRLVNLKSAIPESLETSVNNAISSLRQMNIELEKIKRGVV